MYTPFLLLFPLAAVFQSAVPQQDPVPQTPPDRKVRIEIVTTENGETKRVTKEFDASDEAQMQEALRELGVLDHMSLGEGDHEMTIDIRGFGEDVENDADLFLHMAPAAPLAPMDPIAPMVPMCEKNAYLGVSMDELTPELAKKNKTPKGEGAYVSEVMEDTPAAEIGLKEGDIITALDGAQVQGANTLTEMVRAHKPGDKVELTWYRDGRKMSGSVALAERKEMSYSYDFSSPPGGGGWDWENGPGAGAWSGEPRAFLGVTPGDDAENATGAQIGGIVEGTAAEAIGLKEGDVITAVNGNKTADFSALSETILAMKPGEAVSLKVRRDGKEMELNGTLGETEDDTMMRLRGMNGFEGIAPGEREELRREMDELRREMSELRREMGKDLRREVRIKIETRQLTEEEKTLLRNKGVTGLDNELELGDLRAFPNPSNGFYRLQFELPERNDLAVDVYDAAGERVYQERIVGFKGRYERTLDLSDRASGSYFLVISQGGKTATTKLVKE